MTEKLPKECAPTVDNLARALGGPDFVLGVTIDCGKLGNIYRLAVSQHYGKNDEPGYLVKVDFSDVRVSGLKHMVDAVWPDIWLKPTKFMPLSRLVSDFKLDKEQLAVAVLKGIRSRMKKSLASYDGANRGVHVFCAANYNEKLRFKSFSEFLVWVDLNAQ